jgi:hypothetical protein
MDVNQMSLKELKEIVGDLSRPSKMPGYGYSLPASACQTGSKLRLLPNTPCSRCYAFRGQYILPTVPPALQRRLESLTHPFWIPAMARLINHYGRKVGYFRWHDSGDLQSVAHLEAIARVCELTPTIRHWLPTQERRYVEQYLQVHGDFPANLCVRVSSPILGGVVPKFPRHPMLSVSVVTTADRADAYNCPSRHQGNKCGACRACWTRDVRAVAYHKH